MFFFFFSNENFSILQTAWVQNRENQANAVTLLRLVSTSAANIELVLQDGNGHVSGTGASDSEILAFPEDEWVYVGVSWRQADGRVLLRVLYNDGFVEQEYTTGVNAGSPFVVSHYLN